MKAAPYIQNKRDNYKLLSSATQKTIIKGVHFQDKHKEMK